MITLLNQPMTYSAGRLTPAEPGRFDETARDRTIARRILKSHDTAKEPGRHKIRFDALTSHDITYVGIVQTARASGMARFPLPYVLTNCHNSLCAVGGTINEDDHLFGLSAAKKYGGIYVPAHLSVIHQYMRETEAAGGGMILGSDSHTRYGALGCMGVGEGGPELVKQLLNQTWDIPTPEVVAIELIGAPQRGVGPHDVALKIIGAVFENGFVKNKVMEFIGPGVAALSAEYRLGIDVMTTETTCLSSIWATDDTVRNYLALHGREWDYQQLSPGEGAGYDAAIRVDLSKIPPMIALPFHPSNALPIEAFLDDPAPHLTKIDEAAAAMVKKGAPPKLGLKLRKDGFYVDQGIIAGCAGGLFENIAEAADMLLSRSVGSDAFALSVYPSSQPLTMGLMKDGALSDLLAAGAILRSAFCGPCFGAGDVPSNGAFSIRHTTRNFENREGARPSDGQIAFVALMDARSIAATARNGGKLTPATHIEYKARAHKYAYDDSSYASRVYDGWGKPQPDQPLIFGPGIADWPEMIALPENLLLTVASAITDPVTTTDELIPSGETASYRSNPMKLAEFTLSRKDPGYVAQAKRVYAAEVTRRTGEDGGEEMEAVIAALKAAKGDSETALKKTGLGSAVFALKPGDGSAREQAASCQRVLGGCANIAAEYATKRYRSNLINWGMLPLTMAEAMEKPLEVGDFLYLPGIRARVEAGDAEIPAVLIRGEARSELTLQLPSLTAEEREILLAGCLINYYRERM